MGKKFALHLVILMATSPSFAAPNQFYPALEAPEIRPSVGGSRVMSVGFEVETLAPLSNPFSYVSGSARENFRFQAPSSFGLEFNYGLSKSFDLGLSLAYGRFESRFQSVSGASTRIETVQYRSLPIAKILGRYRKSLSPGVALETELGLGFSSGQVKVSSTDLSTQESTQKISSFVGHAGVGTGLAWTDEISVHFLLGYGYNSLGAKTYSTNIYSVAQNASFSGLFLKGQVRYQF